MTLMFELPTELETRLRQEAARAGLDPVEYARRVVASHLSVPAPAAGAVSDLFARWGAEDQVTDGSDLARRQEEFDRFKESMNRNRTDSEGPAARRPFP